MTPPAQTLATIEKIEGLTRSGAWFYATSIENLEPTQSPNSPLVKDWRIPRETGEYLHNLIRELRPRRVLELGTSTGYSALWIGSALTTYGGYLDTVEYFDLKIPIAKGFIHEAGLEDVVTVHHCRIRDFLRENNKTQNIQQPPPCLPPNRGRNLKKEFRKYDMVFMDADKTNYLEYWNIMQPLLNQHCVIIADNATNYAASMQPWVTHCQSDPTLSCKLIPVGTGLFVVKRHHDSTA